MPNQSSFQTELPRIGVAIVNWNTKKFLARCVDSLLDQNYPKRKLKIALVDQASTDGSQRFIRNHYTKLEQVHYIQTGKNLGFTGGHNAGLKYLLKQPSVEYIAVLNIDAYADKNWLRNIVHCFKENPTAGIITSHILFYEKYQTVKISTNGATPTLQSITSNVSYRVLIKKNQKEWSIATFPLKFRSNDEILMRIPIKDTSKKKPHQIIIHYH